MARQDERDQITVPDTLDLAERAALALRGIARTSDPNDDYLMWFNAFLNTRPPYLQHYGGDTDCTPKFAEALPQLRLMCGSDQGRDVEQAQFDALVSNVSREDGLFYAVYKPTRPWHAQAHPHAYQTQPEDAANVLANGQMMLTLMFRRGLEETTRWDDLIVGIARGLERIAIHKDDYAYFPDGGFGGAFNYPHSGWLRTDEPLGEHEGGEGSVLCYHGYQLRALAVWAARTGDEQALAFAGKLARFMLKPKFWGGVADPILCNAKERGHVDSHFHARAIGLRGLLEYGLVANDSWICDFVRNSYEYMRMFGIPALGFIPTFMVRAFPPYVGGEAWRRTNMEGCFLGDAAALTARLSLAGYGDFWDDLDRLARNHLVEAQLVDKSVLERIIAHNPERAPGADYNLRGKDIRQSIEQAPGFEYHESDVVDRVIGTFGGDLGITSIEWMRSMQCCTSNAARGLFYVWDSITVCDGDRATVNLLLNRMAPWLDVESFLPHEGRAVVRNKTARHISVRIPSWVNRSQLECRVNKNPCTPSWVSCYATFDDLNPGDVLDVRFPVVEKTIASAAHAGTSEETEYRIKVRGTTVVDISPRDESPRSYPFYQRDHLKTDHVPLKTVRPYVAPAIPRW